MTGFPLEFHPCQDECIPVGCIEFLSIHTFTAQNAGFSGRDSVWLKFTASEDKPRAPTVVLPRHSRESGNPEVFVIEVDSRFRGNDGLSRNLLPV